MTGTKNLEIRDDECIIFIPVSVGIHTPELPSVEWMDDDVQSEMKSDFKSFGNVSRNP